MHYEEHRKNLLNKMKENSVAIIFSGVSKITSEDEFYPFVVNRNFFYLTGIEQENSILMLIKGIGITKEYLFIDPFDPVKVRWTGKKLSLDEASNISHMQNVYVNTTYESMLELALTKVNNQYGNIHTLYLDLSPEIKIKDETSTKHYKEEVEAKFPYIEVEDVYPIIMRLRMVKSDEEVEEIRKAINKTNVGLNNLMNKLRPGVYEYELADHFDYIGREKGHENNAFDTICGAGINSTCLHYPTQDCLVEQGDVVLFDLGYRSNLYCADISRTYPVDGVFSPIQREIYEAVLATNKAVIAYAVEGRTIGDLQALAVERLKNECVRRNLMKPDDDIRKYYFHGVSHHLGLDTHDASDRSIPLEKGNVITVEPGLYFPEYKVGVRIEDDILITDRQAEVLSSGIIKEVKDIERMLQKRK